MGEGRFIQAGLEAPSTTSVDGFGQFVNVASLEQLERNRVRAIIDGFRPDQFDACVQKARAKIDGDAAVERLRQELAGIVGINNVAVAIKMATEEAARQAAADAKRATAESAKASTARK